MPPGFCIPGELYVQWLNGLGQESAPQRVLPQGLSDAVSSEYQEMAVRCGIADPAVAVRSSALDEDGLNSSFAGQYDTYLNIKGLEAIGAA